jgi:hypothetical protein
MKKLLFGTLLFVVAFASSCVVHAHSPKRTVRVPHTHVHTPVVNAHWVYVRGYWDYNVWVEARWVRRSGIHPHAHRAGWTWVPGHYRTRHTHKKWVPGHWSRR